MLSKFFYHLSFFSILRFELMKYTDRALIKNRELLYTYYVSFIFQIFIMPILTVAYFLDKVDYNTVLYSAMSYFISDFPEILYNKDYTYMIHHIISLLILKSAKHLPKEVHSRAVINLFLLEIGSSVLSLPIIFKKNILYTLRPYVFFISRIITIINTAYLIKNPKLHFYTKMAMSFLSILLIADNSKTLIKLCKKNIQHSKGGLRRNCKRINTSST